MPNEHQCKKCEKTWGGYLTSHCAACHETFSGLRAYDRHRIGSHTRRRCLHPLSAGLTDAGRKYPCWGPPSDNRWEDDEERSTS